MRAALLMAGGALAMAAGLLGCELDERADFLLGRECDQMRLDTCDPGDACLPHQWLADGPRDFRCRSEASFSPLTSGGEPPLAYCSSDFVCPGTTVCRADRVRPIADGGIRREVCQDADSPFGPP